MANYNRVPADERFWKFVASGGPDECWEWLGGRAGHGTTGIGYGQFYLEKHRPIGAHRYSWALHSGQPIPEGRHVLHHCDNPGCVNPAHLFVGTASDNMWDKSRKGRNPGNPTSRGGPKARYTWQTIQALRDEGRTFQQIGELLDVAPSTAYRTLHRR